MLVKQGVGMGAGGGGGGISGRQGVNSRIVLRSGKYPGLPPKI